MSSLSQTAVIHTAFAKRHARSGVPVRVSFTKNEVYATIEEHAETIMVERGLSKENAVARVLKQQPELYALYEASRPDPAPALIEKVEEPSALPTFVAERVARLRSRDPNLSTERAIARVLKADPELYRRWCAEDAEEPGNAA